MLSNSIQTFSVALEGIGAIITQSISRNVHLDGGINFRDLGGYKSKTGKQVKWRTLLRCGHMAQLTANDLRALNELNVGAIHDLRKTSEQQKYPNNTGTIPQFTEYQMTLGSMDAFTEYASKAQLSADIARNLMTELYRSALDTTRSGLALFMQNVVSQPNPVLIFHCMAGKDRTGLAAAALLMALEVSEEEIIKDYVLTQLFGNTQLITEYVMKGLAKKGITDVSAEALLPYCSVEEDYMVAFLEELHKAYGSAENYLHDGLGVSAANIATLQERYLE